jgi:hypothetical protein
MKLSENFAVCCEKPLTRISRFCWRGRQWREVRGVESADAEKKGADVRAAQGFRCCRWLVQPSAIYLPPHFKYTLDREVLVRERLKNII